MITSTSSSQVKHVVNLQKKAKLRKEEKQFVVEGVKMVSEAPAERMNYDSIGKDVLEIVTDNVFMRMADPQAPQGIMAVVRMSDTDLEGILSDKHNPLLLIIENLQDPGNLGTIVRMAEGAGVTGIIMSSNTVDIYNPKTIRSTMGSLYRVPVIYVDDICEAADVCKSKGVTVYAAHLKGTDNYNKKDYTNPTAFMIGNEGNGLTDKLADKADEYVRIPMQGEVESLNAAIACTILTYEAVRQRL